MPEIVKKYIEKLLENNPKFTGNLELNFKDGIIMEVVERKKTVFVNRILKRIRAGAFFVIQKSLPARRYRCELRTVIVHQIQRAVATASIYADKYRAKIRPVRKDE